MTDVRFQTLSDLPESGIALPGEIPPEQTYLLSLKAGETRLLPAAYGAARIFILSRGRASVGEEHLSGRATLALAPCGELAVSAEEDALMLLIVHPLRAEEIASLGDRLPYRLDYDDALRYREACKSEKTVSRYLLRERIIPRIAIGSVETYGTDRIANHEHPYVDQLFFSFGENDMELVIGDEGMPMKGDTLIHIPLASSHGVRVGECGCAHYVWIDFIVDEVRGMEFLETAHVVI